MTEESPGSHSEFDLLRINPRVETYEEGRAKIEKEIERRLGRVRMLESNGAVQTARKEHHQLIADLLHANEIKPGDEIDITEYNDATEDSLLTGLEQKFQEEYPGETLREQGLGDSGEFIELTNEAIVLHHEGNDVDFAHPINGIVDIRKLYGSEIRGKDITRIDS